MSDWLDEEPAKALAAPQAVPAEFVARVALVEECWGRLSVPQRNFLTAWREAGFNARAAARTLGQGVPGNYGHFGWAQEPDYGTVMRVWRAMAADRALDKDRLLARQDAIVESLLTPKPVLHQGIPVMHNGVVLEEVEAGAASRANEVLLDRVMPKPSDKNQLEVNVGVAVQNGPPTLSIQVLPSREKRAVSQGVVVDAKYTEVPGDVGWLDA